MVTNYLSLTAMGHLPPEPVDSDQDNEFGGGLAPVTERQNQATIATNRASKNELCLLIMSPVITAIYFVAENLVLWARSETIGYAVNPAVCGSGMMEYWKVGMLGLVEWDLFL